jgi:hypothetical protein
MSRAYLPQCNCGSGLPAPAIFDGHGIFLPYASRNVSARSSPSGTNEPIEPDC